MGQPTGGCGSQPGRTRLVSGTALAPYRLGSGCGYQLCCSRPGHNCSRGLLSDGEFSPVDHEPEASGLGWAMMSDSRAPWGSSGPQGRSGNRPSSTTWVSPRWFLDQVTPFLSAFVELVIFHASTIASTTKGSITVRSPSPWRLKSPTVTQPVATDPVGCHVPPQLLAKSVARFATPRSLQPHAKSAFGHDDATVADAQDCPSSPGSTGPLYSLSGPGTPRDHVTTSGYSMRALGPSSTGGKDSRRPAIGGTYHVEKFPLPSVISQARTIASAPSRNWAGARNLMLRFPAQVAKGPTCQRPVLPLR